MGYRDERGQLEAHIEAQRVELEDQCPQVLAGSAAVERRTVAGATRPVLVQDQFQGVEAGAPCLGSHRGGKHRSDPHAPGTLHLAASLPDLRRESVTEPRGQ